MLYKQLKKIKKNKEFSYIYKTGRKVYVKSTGIFWIKSRGPETGYGITTSKRFKSAVTRNKIRRRIRGIIKEEVFFEGFKFVVYVKETALALSFAELKEEVRQGLLRAKIIK